jgi:curli biogenesis system outer membrane secretion channel CsgG
VNNIFATLSLSILCLTATVSPAQSKKRIAISIADPMKSTSYGYANQNDQAAVKSDIEEKIVDALTSRLSQNQGLILLDRQKIQDVLQEQNNKMDGRFDGTSGVKLGKLMGADVLVFVRVESYAVNESQQTSNKFAYIETSRIGDVNLTVVAKALGVETESVLAAPTSAITKHEVLQKTKQMANTPSTAYNRQSGQTDPALLKLRDVAIDEAAQELSSKLFGVLASAPTPAVSPKVAGIDDGKVMLNKGISAGIKIGDTFTITRLVDSGIKDPDTNKPIIRKKVVCSLKISELEESFSLGVCSGDTPQAGDIATLGGKN